MPTITRSKFKDAIRYAADKTPLTKDERDALFSVAETTRVFASNAYRTVEGVGCPLTQANLANPEKPTTAHACAGFTLAAGKDAGKKFASAFDARVLSGFDAKVSYGSYGKGIVITIEDDPTPAPLSPGAFAQEFSNHKLFAMADFHKPMKIISGGTL